MPPKKRSTVKRRAEDDGVGQRQTRSRTQFDDPTSAGPSTRISSVVSNASADIQIPGPVLNLSTRGRGRARGVNNGRGNRARGRSSRGRGLLGRRDRGSSDLPVNPTVNHDILSVDAADSDSSFRRELDEFDAFLEFQRRSRTAERAQASSSASSGMQATSGTSQAVPGNNATTASTSTSNSDPGEAEGLQRSTEASVSEGNGGGNAGFRQDGGQRTSGEHVQNFGTIFSGGVASNVSNTLGHSHFENHNVTNVNNAGNSNNNISHVSNNSTYSSLGGASFSGSTRQALTSICDPLGQNLPRNLKDKIIKGEFVDFGLLLDKRVSEVQFTSSDSPVFGFNSEGQFVLKESKPQQRITSINSWTSAFFVYTAVYLSAHPSRTQELLKYGQIIRMAAARVPGYGWRDYDIQFRLRQQSRPHNSWATMDGELWNFYIAVPTPVVPSKFHSNSQGGAQSSFRGKGQSRGGQQGARHASGGFCFAFNGKAGCSRNPCRYSHVCQGCNTKGHGIISCKKGSKN